MRNYFKAYIFLFLSYFIPALSLAADSDLKSFVYNTLIGKIVTPLTGIVISLIIMYFFYNSAIFLFKTDKSADEKKKIMQSLMWSVIILFLLVSVWGIVKMLASTLSLETSI